MKGKGKAKILVVDDEASIREVLSRALSGLGEVALAAAGGEAKKLFSSERPDLVFLDIKLPDADGLELLKEFKSENEEASIVIMTAHGDMTKVAESMRGGAYEYVEKPFDLVQVQEIATKVLRSMTLAGSSKEPSKKELERSSLGSLVGASKAMVGIIKQIGRLANGKTSVLITGESGTGKELVARAIHDLGAETERPFVAVDCMSLSATLLESELFGHEKGSFTGADKQRIGRFEQAHGGTLFLDEIGNLSLDLQAKLLRVLQERQFERVGGEETISVKVRLVAATNRELKAEVSAGRFREDLYFRVNVVPLRLPPLRERKEDIALLVESFRNRQEEAYGGKAPRFTGEAMAALANYDWPGNIRELQNAVESALVGAKGKTVDVEDLPEHVRRWDAGAMEAPGLAELTKAIGEGKAISLEGAVEEMEDQLIAAAMHKARGVKKKAAQLLGIKRQVLEYKLKKQGRVAGQG